MIVFIGELLAQDQVERLRELMEQTRFVDGRETAGQLARQVKRNNQVDSDDERLPEMRRIVADALEKNRLFYSAARPKHVKPPMFSRYVPGMEYGNHVDDAIMAGMRTDLSFTLFLSTPESYDGGELVIDSTAGEQDIKLPAGSAVLYPSTSLHRVAPVTRGERLAAVTWIRSFIRDPARREILFDLDRVQDALIGRGGKTLEVDLLAKTQSNLLRLWAED
ncbi:MAG: Fe2+-dependent dioxygenase [Reyranellaceae bacterium]